MNVGKITETEHITKIQPYLYNGSHNRVPLQMKTRGIITIYDRQLGSPRSSYFLGARDIIRHVEYRSGRYLRIPYTLGTQVATKSRNSLDDRPRICWHKTCVVNIHCCRINFCQKLRN